MKPYIKRIAIAAFASLSIAAGIASAADAGAASKAPPVPAVAPDTPEDQLALRLSPLTRDDLAQEAQAWLAILKSKTGEVVDKRIALKDAKGAEAERLTAALGPLTTQRREISAKLGDVLDAWEAKGGDPKAIQPYRQYIQAVYAEQIKATGITALWTQLMNWLVSADGGLALLVKIMVVVLAFVVLWVVAMIVSRLARKALSRVPNVSMLLTNFLASVAFWVTIGAGLLVVLAALGANIAGVLALVGGASFIIAFAMQNTLSNFAAGLMIMIYRPFDVGNYVTVAGVSGTVKEVSLVSTTVTTPDNQVIIIPNGNVWGSVITNVTGSDTRRVDLVFGIGYQDDAATAQRIMEEVATEHPLVLKEPAPVIRLHELGESSVNFVCRPWSRTSDYWSVYWDITRRVKERFDAEGVSIPFPQRDVHLYTVEAKPALPAGPRLSA
jgi:small conductance mechanosensitive channel